MKIGDTVRPVDNLSARMLFSNISNGLEFDSLIGLVTDYIGETKSVEVLWEHTREPSFTTYIPFKDLEVLSVIGVFRLFKRFHEP